jgi:hypothetical protein
MPLLILAWFAAICSWGYIPKTRTLLDRLAKTQGAGLYSIDLEVTLRGANGVPLVIEESWWVQNGETQKVIARTPGGEAFFVATYRGTDANRTGLGLAGQGTIGKEFFEPVFHQRVGGNLTKWLLNHRVLPSGAFSARPMLSKSAKPEPDPHASFTKLGNQFAIGLGSPNSRGLDVRLWLDTDQYYLKKIRLVDGTEIVSDAYEQQPRGLWYPRERVVTFAGKSAVLRTVAVRSRNDTVDFTPAAISSMKLRDASLPSEIVEFYSRFR